MQSLLDSRQLRPHQQIRAVVPDSSHIYLDVVIDSSLEHRFYTGFSGDIADGGIFVSTFQLKPLNTPATVRIAFFNQKPITVNGHVHWLREYNSQVPEISPGIGIRFVQLTAETRQKINGWLQNHPAYFYDDIKILKRVRRRKTKPGLAKSTSSAQQHQPTLPLFYDPAQELQNETSFFHGISRAVGAGQWAGAGECATVPATAASPPPQIAHLPETNRPAADYTSAVVPPNIWPGGFPAQETIRAIVAPNLPCGAQFSGGFFQDRGGHRLFVNSSYPRPVGSNVQIELWLSEHRQLKLTGRVVWIRRHNPLIQNQLTAGMGIELDNLPLITAYALATHTPKGQEILTCEEIG